ncbi:hypothetical protein CAPTEDRAFT_181873 [Capitella teleta]|uniref:F-box domain-containing protein n=1 Tax=Capitella teleta TaxID=283909 RepID=R7UWS7_CAPTE|nr:hypothetical protein CAPTEDRAFT_181873 [Capitella teleta]|eukprot:ELU08387.1 hypothetical protein CAPTEDRAFT_181873 [Capitella teleta]
MASQTDVINGICHHSQPDPLAVPVAVGNPISRSRCPSENSAPGPSQEIGLDIINSLPDEILELLLSHLSPYRDYKNAMLVCKRWHRIIQGVRVQELERFHLGVQEGHLRWHIMQTKTSPTVTDRYSHCACYHRKLLYVFGGCASTCTTFNDLWCLNLSRGEWIRPLTSGVYPSPTACATLVSHNDQLILFGGWCHPTPNTFYQSSKVFNQLHSFDTITNKWSRILCPVMPQGKAGHGATVLHDMMIVFGGYHGQTSCSNQIWVYHIVESNWTKMEIEGAKPVPRYGHTQVLLGDSAILIVGGFGGPNKQLNDMWLLNIGNEAWSWHRIDVINIQNAAPQLWCHPGCLVGDKIVVVSKNLRITRAAIQSQKEAKPPVPRTVWIPPKEDAAAPQHDHRLCGYKAHAKRAYPETSESSSQESSSDNDDVGGAGAGMMASLPRSPRMVALQKSVGRSLAQGKLSMERVDRDGTSGSRPGMPSVRPNAMRNRQKQLETLKYYESKLKQTMNNKEKAAAANEEDLCSCIQPHARQNPMYVHVLDVSRVVRDRKATWLQTHDQIDSCTPEETIFHSLVQGRGELIMFGGVQMDLSSMQKGLHSTPKQVSNIVHFIRPKRSVRS